MKDCKCLIIPEILPAEFVPNECLSILINLHTIVLVGRPSCLPLPVTTKCVFCLSLSSDHNLQVLMASENVFCSSLQQVVYVLSSTFD